MAWKLPRDGGGFDTGGPERVWQAKTVSPTDKGVYEGYTSFNPFDFHPGGGGVRLSPMGEDINRFKMDQKTRGQGYIDPSGIINTEEKFFNRYPNIPKTFNYPEDVYTQEVLPDEPDEDYKWLAGGGIASTRPGYAWGGGIEEEGGPPRSYPDQTQWITKKPDINEWITKKSDQNWITKRPDQNWITKKPDINEWITKRSDNQNWITRKKGMGISSGEDMDPGMGISSGEDMDPGMGISSGKDMDPGMGIKIGPATFNELMEWWSGEEENLAGGGIASTRPGYAWGGESIGAAGGPIPDRTGAAGWLSRLRKDLTKSQRGERLLADTMRANIQPYAGGNMMDNWTSSGRDFRDTHHYTKGPASFNELMEWWSGEEENLAGGGIASTRPGYAWGGSAKQGSSVTPITDIPWSDKPGLLHKEWKRWNKGSFDKPRHERFERGYLPDRGWFESYQSPFGTQTGMTVEPEWYEQRGHRGFNVGEPYAMMQPGKGSSKTPTLDPVSKLYEDEWEAGTFPEAWRPKGLLEDWSDYPFKNDKRRFGNWQGGGAVGLEPGIASLMGYAKGGMVTKVKVPKGQSKWMKKFMNNMRDN